MADAIGVIPKRVSKPLPKAGLFVHNTTNGHQYDASAFGNPWDLTKTIVWTGWARWGSVDAGGDDETIITFGSASTATEIIMFMIDEPNDRWAIYDGDFKTDDVTALRNLWHFHVGVHDVTDGGTETSGWGIFSQGVYTQAEVTTATDTVAPATGVSMIGNNPFGREFEGSIADIRVYQLPNGTGPATSGALTTFARRMYDLRKRDPYHITRTFLTGSQVHLWVADVRSGRDYGPHKLVPTGSAPRANTSDTPLALVLDDNFRLIPTGIADDSTIPYVAVLPQRNIRHSGRFI